MKKVICSLLTILILINSAFVICYADSESFVTKAVNAVKSKIDIPENYSEFNSKVTVEPGTHYAYLTWYGDDDEFNSGGQINVTVDDKFRILSFSRYFYGEFTGNYKLSKYTSKYAEESAKEFVSVACPEFYPHTKLVEQEYSVHRNFEPYEFTFVRYENGLPCYDNYITVTVDASNCIVSSFDVKWIDYDKVYPSNTKLTAAEASASMYANIGMVKEYAQKTNGEFFVRYTDLSDGINYINAYTGNIVNTNYISEGSYKNALTSEKKFDFYYSVDAYEIDYAISVVENSEYVAPGSKFTLTGIQYLQDAYGNYLYMYYDDFNGSIKTYIVDVYTGDIRYFDYHQYEIGSENLGYNQEQCENIADDFVLKHNGSFIESCRLLNSNNQKNYIGEDVYYFNYTRFINDIAYDENGVVVGVSRSTGKIVSVSSGWDVIDIPEYPILLSAEEVFDKYINASGFELQYVTAKSMTREMELRAVYAPNPMTDVYIDAVTGDVVDGDGIEINAEKITYKDISKDVSGEQIKTLNACGILDDAEMFNPDENVLLCDYLLWMCRAVDCVKYKNIYDVAEKLVNCGVVTYEELELNPYINTEKGIKYIVTYLGYGELAKLPDTFKTGFVDEGMISEDLIGYAAIAKGLGIFRGNAFMPQSYIKRNVAAEILYNLISY